MPNHQEHANLIWQIADLLRGPYRPPQYERVMLPMTVLRRFDCVLAPTKAKVLAEHEKRKGGKLSDDALDRVLSKAAGQRFHNHSPLTFEKLNGDPDNIEKHLVIYINGFSAAQIVAYLLLEMDGPSFYASAGPNAATGCSSFSPHLFWVVRAAAEKHIAGEAREGRDGRLTDGTAHPS